LYRNEQPHITEQPTNNIRSTDTNIITKGDVNLSRHELTKLPHFKYVSGELNCYHNQLTSLKGCATYVGSNLNCYCNQLTSLEGCATYIGGKLDCDYNQLTSLEGCATRIGDILNCRGNYVKLSFPEGVKVGGEFRNEW